MSQKDFAEHVLKMAKSDEMFTPSAYYDADGDCIEFIFQPDPFYAKRMDNLVTVYYSQDTNSIIGSQIKSVSKFCKEKLESNRAFQIVIQGGKIKLQHIFCAQIFDKKEIEINESNSVTYGTLLRAAEASNLEALEGVC